MPKQTNKQQQPTTTTDNNNTIKCIHKQQKVHVTKTRIFFKVFVFE